MWRHATLFVRVGAAGRGRMENVKWRMENEVEGRAEGKSKTGKRPGRKDNLKWRTRNEHEKRSKWEIFHDIHAIVRGMKFDQHGGGELWYTMHNWGSCKTSAVDSPSGIAAWCTRITSTAFEFDNSFLQRLIVYQKCAFSINPIRGGNFKENNILYWFSFRYML